MYVLVTGAAGSLGSALTERLRSEGHHVVETDVCWDGAGHLDVTNEDRVHAYVGKYGPDVIYHLAADKHAPEGELDPARVARINLDGTRNIVEAAQGAKVICASTCKAANPETAYGASKLIAERIVLNAGGVVCRFYNVRETSGNVFRLWESLPESDPIPWTDCWRYFISLDQAIDLLVRALDLPSGRYTADPGMAQHMGKVAKALYPDRALKEIPARRGDRKTEPRKGTSERIVLWGDDLHQIICAHDAVPIAA